MYCPNDECPDFVAHGVRVEYREGLVTRPRCGSQPSARVARPMTGLA